MAIERNQVNLKWPDGLRDKVKARAKRTKGDVSMSEYTQQAVRARMLMEDWGVDFVPYNSRGGSAMIPAPISSWRLHYLRG